MDEIAEGISGLLTRQAMNLFRALEVVQAKHKKPGFFSARGPQRWPPKFAGLRAM